MCFKLLILHKFPADIECVIVLYTSCSVLYKYEL